MNDNQIQACLQLLAEKQEEPDWTKLEDAVMESISFAGRKTSLQNNIFLPVALMGFCLVFWAVLAAGVAGAPQENAGNPEQLTVLSMQEERIIMKYPETAVLLHGMKPERSGYDLYESMAKRHSFLKGD